MAATTEPTTKTPGGVSRAAPGRGLPARAPTAPAVVNDGPARESGQQYDKILAALAAAGPTTATDLADRLPISRQAIAKHLALLTEAGLVKAEPGERRRVRYRLQSAPMQVAQQFLAALARDWDRSLDALQEHLDGFTGEPM